MDDISEDEDLDFIDDFLPQSSNTIYDLFRIKKIQIEMMKIRGYDISHEEHILSLNLEQFNNLLLEWADGNIVSFWGQMIFTTKKNNEPVIKFVDKEVKETMSQPRAFLTNIYKKSNEEDYSCVVFYIARSGSGKHKIDKPTMEPIRNFIVGSTFENVIIISNKNFGKFSLSLISNLPAIINSNKVKVPRGLWIFRDKELFVNPIFHTLNGDYQLLSEQESKEFRKLYVHPLQISTEDPIIKFYGWPVGKVVKIIRDISGVEGMIDTMVAKRLIVRDNLVELSLIKNELINF